jgi:mannose-6-phosphate isomerase-like protein (cupin superfamily)
MKRSTFLTVIITVIAVIFLLSTLVYGSWQGSEMISVTDQDLVWNDYEPEGFGPGLKVAVVHGDPSVPDQPYTIRASFVDGYNIPAHYHPRAENLTVLSGTFMLAMGKERDDSKLVAYRPGDFLYIPGKHVHYGKARGPTVIQLHGIGPFQTIVVEEELAGN